MDKNSFFISPCVAKNILPIICLKSIVKIANYLSIQLYIILYRLF